MDDLLADFLTETNEGLAELDSALVKLERNPGDEAMLSLIFRRASSLDASWYGPACLSWMPKTWTTKATGGRRPRSQ